MTDLLDVFRAAGVLDALDVSFARAMGRLAGGARPGELLAAAFASRAPRHGHVCAELRALRETVRIEARSPEDLAGLPWPAPGPWLAQVRRSRLVGPATDAPPATPLVLEGDRLYLARYWRHQQRLLAGIRARVDAPPAAHDAERLRSVLTRLFPAGDDEHQKLAALTAARRRFAVITGGPGTGKTTTVVRLLALLTELWPTPDRPPRIALAAPTGKAAARLTEAVRAHADTLDVPGAVRAALPAEASTLHRLLGYHPARPTRFRHHAGDPLPVDVVVVDEASMVDLALMARLVDALPDAARLVLLGDRDQLTSVEAGAVLGDICNADGMTPGDEDGIGGCVVHLTRTWRFAEGSGIGRAAAAVNAGDADGALDLLRGRPAGVDLIDVEDPDERLRRLRALVTAAYAEATAARDPAVALAALARFRVLCAHRRGPFGVETLNAEIERWLAAAGHVDRRGEWYVGRPVLVTRNDYALGLFNGDLGVVLPDPADPEARRVWFPDPRGGPPRPFHPGRLPPHDTVFALTVHQSQGSEFDRVAVVLPPDPSPILTRELIYTALTRARTHATLVGTEAVLRHAIAQRVRRASGLRAHLWGPPPSTTSARSG